eukprot:m.374028 g.374028  ORF g.374028 m.374028 type:complete len:59 (-) comp70182_c0_seq1:111-287(-)
MMIGAQEHSSTLHPNVKENHGITLSLLTNSKQVTNHTPYAMDILVKNMQGDGKGALLG